MPQSSIIYPVLCQVVLTIAVLLVLGRARSRSMRSLGQQLGDKDVQLGQNAWSEDAIKASNNYKNQFEIPVLFYAAAAFALVLRQADELMIGLAWVFALTRLIHSAVHIGPNSVPLRGLAFLIGVGAVLAMWLVIGWRLANGAGV